MGNQDTNGARAVPSTPFHAEGRDSSGDGGAAFWAGSRRTTGGPVACRRLRWRFCLAQCPGCAPSLCRDGGEVRLAESCHAGCPQQDEGNGKEFPTATAVYIAEGRNAAVGRCRSGTPDA